MMSQIGLSKKGSNRGLPVKKQIDGKQSSKKGLGSIYRLQVKGLMPDLPLEIYNLQIGNNSLGWKEGYTYPIRMHIDSDKPELQIEMVDQIGICAYFNIRDSYESNQPKLGRNDFYLFWLVRVIPGMNPSTNSTRIQGLQQLKELFLDDRYSKYPPKSILTEDITDLETPMDRMFCDRDVMILLNFAFDPDTLNSSFAADFPDHARLVFGGPRYPAEAVNRLGYVFSNTITGPDGSYAAGFSPQAGNAVSKKEDLSAEQGKKEDSDDESGKSEDDGKHADEKAFDEDEDSDQEDSKPAAKKQDSKSVTEHKSETKKKKAETESSTSNSKKNKRTHGPNGNK